MLILVSLGFIFSACGEDSNTREKLAFTDTKEVLNNVFDDDKSTFYIRVDKPYAGEADTAVAEIMMKKRRWETLRPEKKIVAMSIVTGDGGGHGHPLVLGLLIHYENR